MSKLTLSIDKETIDVAKHYAAHHGTSVSRLVERFLRTLEGEDEQEFFAQLHASLKREGYRTRISSGDLEALRRQHAERKYL